ncbi:hypothetical protein MGYG_00811 [Nannizzia gypsea CBS 118893]|uniref:Methyltransferase n=1 Tax=Arthroderma gypseum (strain ATCC MYA-4604 / CBS 118893) TaxID=535722 RepID=E5R1Z1_ARTGP|nr:hypothetical protein MGYG_00811 [Nannizzia gypsea CBS 118893]EFQ97770.1 hypothetical protein MGYG_00811 [Nannizzia gypsea CBS 118893]
MAAAAEDRPDGCSQSTVEADVEQASTVATDFASVVSTIPNFVYENGRRYQGYCVDQYGQGYGLSKAMAELYPSAQVIGTDISPIQPSWRPNNVEFMMDDAQQEWTFPESSFDFIHIRTLGGSISDWPRLMGQCYKRLKPGGRIEVSEARAHFCCDDDTFPEGSKTRHWLDEFNRISHSCGHEFDVFPSFAGWLRNGGFTEVEETEKVVPVGTWPKDKKLKMRGRYFMAQFLGHAMESYSTSLFTRLGGWSADDLWKLLNSVTEEVSSFAIAKRPEQA